MPTCMIALGLAPAGEWYVGRDGVPKPGRRGWRQGQGGMVPLVWPPPRRRCTCKGKGGCKTTGGKARKKCACTPGKPCRCGCCEPVDLPPAGPPHAKGCTALTTAPPHSLTPDELREEIRKATGMTYSRRYMYTLLASLDLSPKTAMMSHVCCPLRRNIQRWQRRARKRTGTLVAKGYTVVALDEAYLVYNTYGGKKHWSLVGRRVFQSFTGSHKRLAVFCAYASDGRRVSRQYAKGDSYAFIKFLKVVTAKFGKVAIIADRYSAHNSHVVREFVKDNRMARPDRDIRMVRLPVGCPFLNVVEKCWNLLKRRVVVGEHHASFGDLRRAAVAFMRTARFNFSLEASLYSDPPPDMAAP